ncbi:MAG: helix-turn-helix domain-containing protein [Gemmatimonadota bacterium]
MNDVFDAVADPVRRGLLHRLRTEGALSVTELSAPLAISRQATTKHLDILVEAGLVRRERRGRERLHHLSAEPLVDLAAWLEPYRAAWDRRLERLAHHLDEGEDEA